VVVVILFGTKKPTKEKRDPTFPRAYRRDLTRGEQLLSLRGILGEGTPENLTNAQRKKVSLRRGKALSPKGIHCEKKKIQQI